MIVEFDEETKKVLAEEVFRRVERRFVEEYGEDLRYVHRQRLRDLEYDHSRRRIIETITGTAGAVGILALLGWLGSVILGTVREMISAGL